MTETPWPFEQPPNEAVVATRSIVENGHAILLVSRDGEDGTWAFLSGEPFTPTNAMLVTLGSVMTKDPSIADLRDLPCGWEASRPRIGETWDRRRSSEE